MKRLVQVLEIVIQVFIFYSLGMYFLELEYAGTENSREGFQFFLWSERVVAAVFSIEYVIRWIYAKNKLKHPITPMAIVDLLAVLPFYVGFMVDLRSLRLVRTLRILRLFKFYRYNDALKSFILSFQKVKGELYIIGIAISILIFLSATIMFECERIAQPEMFTKYSDALWWSFITLTTVGYGDMYPITNIGRISAGLTLIVGLGIFGTFLSLVGSAFMQTFQEAGTVEIDLKTYERLRSMQETRQQPTDDESLKRLIDELVSDRFVQEVKINQKKEE